MALQIDVTRPLLRPSQLEALVAAVVGTDRNNEHDWIEWKRRLDLTQLRTHEHIAKHVLGFSNRPVQVASRHTGGHGYVLIGVQPESITGVDTIDPATRGNAIRRYVGTDGPGWTAEHVCVEGQTVLVVIVDPPQHGDPIHTLRHRLANHDRAPCSCGASAKPGRRHLLSNAELVERARAGRNSLAITVRSTGSTIEGDYADFEERRAARIEAERRLLMAPARASLPCRGDDRDREGGNS